MDLCTLPSHLDAAQTERVRQVAGIRRDRHHGESGKPRLPRPSGRVPGRGLRWKHLALRGRLLHQPVAQSAQRSVSTPLRWIVKNAVSKASHSCRITCEHSESARERYIKAVIIIIMLGAGIAQWLEHRTRDWKVAGSNPCWNGGRIFFSRVDFLCWLLFRYPFHPRVTTVARKKSRSFCQKCRWQVTAKHAYTLRMWILLNRASALVTTCP